MKTLKLGTVSHGTMRPEDLIPDFLWTLEHVAPGTGACSAIRERMEHEDYFSSEDTDQDLDELFDLLGEHCPPYCYFGAHPGDGSDYGCWLCDEWQQLAEDDGVPVVGDAGELPAGHLGEWFCCNDHGNLTLYVRDTAGEDAEIFSAV